jgi:hypothetical protein
LTWASAQIEYQAETECVGQGIPGHDGAERDAVCEVEVEGVVSDAGTSRLPDKPSASKPMEPMHGAPCRGLLSGRISVIRFYSVNSSDKISIMGFHINKKTAEKNAASTKSNKQSGNSKFLSKGSTKSAGAVKKPIKTGGTRGS